MTPEQKSLLERAAQAAQKAYAPYSQFRVGAAVLTDTGIYEGANIENASTNLGTCAERVALSHAIMHGSKTIIGIGICCLDAPTSESATAATGAIMPCGGCRQWLAELAPQAWIVVKGSGRIYSLDDLLPHPFTLKTELS